MTLDLTIAKNRQCVGKVKLLDEAAAKAKAKLLHKKFKKRFNYYQCSFCRYWHTGSDRSKEAAVRRADRSVA